MTDNVPRSRTSGSGIDMNETDQAIVRNNVVDRNNGNGILVEDATDVLVEGNKARFNVGDFAGWGTSGIWLDGGHSVTLRNNWLEGNVRHGCRSPTRTCRIQRATRSTTTSWSATRTACDSTVSVVRQRRPTGSTETASSTTPPPGSCSSASSSSQLTNTRLYGNLLAQIALDQPALAGRAGHYPDVEMNDNLYFRQGSTKPFSWLYSF